MEVMKPFKNIAISSGNYLELKKLGFAGDSFNDVITKLIQDRKNKNTMTFGSGLSPRDQKVIGTVTTTPVGAEATINE